MRQWRPLACALVCAACTGMPEPSPSPDEPWQARNDLLGTQIAMHPTRSQTVFALTPYALGLLKSTDGGRTWILANRGIRSYFLSQVVIDPRDPDVVYVGAGGCIRASMEGPASSKRTTALVIPISDRLSCTRTIPIASTPSRRPVHTSAPMEATPGGRGIRATISPRASSSKIW